MDPSHDMRSLHSNTSPDMTELEGIRQEIETTKQSIATAESDGDINTRDFYRSVLIEQMKGENILLARSTGKFTAINQVDHRDEKIHSCVRGVDNPQAP